MQLFLASSGNKIRLNSFPTQLSAVQRRGIEDAVLLLLDAVAAQGFMARHICLFTVTRDSHLSISILP